MNSLIERLAKAGFALHWLHPKSKRPIGNDWAAKPVATLADLKRTYRENNNVGVRLGKWSVVSGLYLHIIDMDIRKAELADMARTALADLLPELDLDTCPSVISGSGGESRHFYLLTDRPFPPRKFAHSDGFENVWDESRQRDVKKWDWELHLLGTGSQAAIPPSIHPDTGKPYRWLNAFDFDIVDLGLGPFVPSDAIAEMVDAPDETTEVDPERLKPIGLTLDEIETYLNELPQDEWCDDRDGWYRAGMAVHHETGGSEEGFAIWNEWSKQSEKYDLANAKERWRSFKNRAQLPFRMASLVAVVKDIRLEREFSDLGEDDLGGDEDFLDLGDDEDLFDDLLGDAKPRKPSKAEIKLRKEQVEKDLGGKGHPKIQKLNRLHAIARVKGKTVVIDFHDDGTVSYGNVSDLNTFYENDRLPKDDTTEPVSKAWLRSKHRRTYPNGIVFSPNDDIEGAYNLWQGFSVEPDETRSCALFLSHLYEIICDKNAELYEYSLDYFAHMIQRPEEKPGVAYVVKGKKGAGKDTVAEYFARIVANHYITIANKDQMVGKFNAHQEKCLFLHVQEGFWAGDKRDEGALKYLITSEHAMIEPKGMNAFPVKSVLRIFISSNEKWVVPATEDERRFFVLNVSNKRIGDHAYFKRIRTERDNGGTEALLAMLMDRDISKFQVRKVPNTLGLAEQKVEGLKNVERWWYGVLQHGSVDGHAQKDDITNSQWLRGPVRMEKNEFRDAYSRWLRTRRYDGEEVSEMEFSKRMKAMLPQIAVARPRASGSRLHVFILPPLQEARTGFERYIGSELHWPDEDIAFIDMPDDDDL